MSCQSCHFFGVFVIFLPIDEPPQKNSTAVEYIMLVNMKTKLFMERERSMGASSKKGLKHHLRPLR